MSRLRHVPAVRLTSLAVVVAAMVAGAASAQEPAAKPSAEQLAFFESSIRPVLIEQCLECHGQNKQSSALRLDSREGFLKGGTLEGAAVDLEEPDASPLLALLRHEGELKMPPKPRTKLSDAQIADFARWVAMGLPWPEAAVLPSPEAKAEAERTHWAFQPVRRVAPPAVRDLGAVSNPIDAFIVSALEAKGLTPSPRADRRTLLRRVTLDLTGLPPTEDEFRSFLDDPRPDSVAFERVVDRLLASPHYGERWGRHWLDIARYADTKGYVFQEERRYPFAYTFRDYVVESLNADKPYDRFLVEQIAADRLDLGTDKRPLAALGFLTVGRRFLNNQHDIIDDRIDVMGRGILGLTIACARCHDHKYDPIPTEDYYSLHGVFASSVEPSELPDLGTGGNDSETLAYRAELAKKQFALNAFVQSKKVEIAKDYRDRLADYLVATHAIDYQPRHEKLDATAQTHKLEPSRLRAFAGLVAEARKSPAPTSPFLVWDAVAKLPAEQFAEQVPAALKSVRDRDDAEALAILVDSLSNPAPGTLDELSKRFADWLRNTEDAADPKAKAVREAFWSESGPLAISPDRFRFTINRAERNKMQEFEQAVAAVSATHPGAPPKAMVLNDRDDPKDSPILIRGNPGRPGAAAPRRFLKVIAGPDRKPFDQGSGRLQLAQSIASADNPLTARVIVNRLWAYHFGQGLVRTASDFGTRSDPPSNPELLDYLAATLVADQWSLKSLHRLMVTSSTYQQRSEFRPEAATVDPENMLVWRQNRRRLDFESLRDSLLAQSGQLDRRVGGRPVTILEAPFTPRRTLYGFIDRQNLEQVYRTFDFASPDSSSPGRPITTVPQQALFLLNSPFVSEQAKGLARRAEAETSDDATRVERLYNWLYGRSPDELERQLGVTFLQSGQQGASNATGVWQYGHGAIDEAAGRVARFDPMPHFTGQSWQFGPEMPSPEGAYLSLNAEGGHPGPSPDRAVIRRWIAPVNGVVRVGGLLHHPGEVGDGVRARLVSSRQGVVATWTAKNERVPTRVEEIGVEPGDTLDFVVDCRESDNTDSFRWAASVRFTMVMSATPAARMAWNAREDFQGPPPAPLNPLEAYAQVLLLTNEFSFVD